MMNLKTLLENSSQEFPWIAVHGMGDIHLGDWVECGHEISIVGKVTDIDPKKQTVEVTCVDKGGDYVAGDKYDFPVSEVNNAAPGNLKRKSMFESTKSEVTKEMRDLAKAIAIFLDKDGRVLVQSDMKKDELKNKHDLIVRAEKLGLLKYYNGGTSSTHLMRLATKEAGLPLFAIKSDSKKVTEEAGMSAGATSPGGQGILTGPENQVKDGVLGPTNFNIPVRIGEVKKRLLSKYDYNVKRLDKKA